MIDHNEKTRLSLVVPLYNEARGLEKFYDRLAKAITAFEAEYTVEIVFIDDGSKDATVAVASSLAERDERIRLAVLSRNYGKEIALTAGIEAASGDIIMALDGDGQHPPELIPVFLEKWKNGADVVVGVRKANQKEGFVKKYGSKIFYKLFNSIAGIALIPGSTDFRLITAEVAKEFLQIRHHHRVARGLIDWLGYERDFVEFSADARMEGEATYSIPKLISLATNTFVSLSFVPLKVFMVLGFGISILSVVVGLLVFVQQFLLNDFLGLNVTGSGYLALLILFITGIVLASQSATSVYIAHMYYNVGNRPLYSLARRKSIRLK